MRKSSTFLFAAALTMISAVPAMADGAADYKAKCQICHAADLSGNTPMGKKFSIKDLRSAEVQKKTDAELIAVTKNGKNKMPAFKDKLSDEQINGIIEFIRKSK